MAPGLRRNICTKYKAEKRTKLTVATSNNSKITTRLHSSYSYKESCTSTRERDNVNSKITTRIHSSYKKSCTSTWERDNVCSLLGKKSGMISDIARDTSNTITKSECSWSDSYKVEYESSSPSEWVPEEKVLTEPSEPPIKCKKSCEFILEHE